MADYDDDNLERHVHIHAEHVELGGTLGLPADAGGVVLFAHGSRRSA